MIQSRHALHQLFQIPFISGKKDGKRSQKNILWRICRNPGKYLAVRDHHFGLLPQRRQHPCQFIFLKDNGSRIRFQDIAYGLLLGQDQPSLGSSLVNGHYQHCKILWFQQISHNPAAVLPDLSPCGQALLKIGDPLTGQGTDFYQREALFPIHLPRIFLFQVHLVTDDHTGDPLFLYAF